MPPQLPRAGALAQRLCSSQQPFLLRALFSSTASAAAADSQSSSSSSKNPSSRGPGFQRSSSARSQKGFSKAFPAPRPPPPPRAQTATLESSNSSLLGIGNNTGPLGGGALSDAAAAGTAAAAGAPGGGGPQPGDAASRMLERYRMRHDRSVYSKHRQLEILRNQKNSQQFLRQMPRRFQPGDVYSPHDMSPVEMTKWRKWSSRNTDVVDALGIRPLDMYKNFSLVQDFTTSSGQIIHSSQTSLRPVNQRKIAKMIRRIQGMGIYPTIHDHPEMIRNDFFPAGIRDS